MFCTALKPLLAFDADALAQLDEIQSGFSNLMREQLETMFAAKLGLATFNPELFSELVTLMLHTQVDYTIFFRELSSIPNDIGPLQKSFYANTDAELDQRWTQWLTNWRSLVTYKSDDMKRVNPKYSLREWLLAPVYQQAAAGNYTPLRELQEVMTQPYAEQSPAVTEKYYRRKPTQVNVLGGVSHMSCSS
jgi:uncharacterized protein YdiU (UPF0061 family)